MKFSPGYLSLEGQTLRKLKPVRFDFYKGFSSRKVSYFLPPVFRWRNKKVAERFRDIFVFSNFYLIQ